MKGRLQVPEITSRRPTAVVTWAAQESRQMPSRYSPSSTEGLRTDLSSDLVETLRALGDAPPGVAEAVIGLLGAADRARLVDCGVIEPIAGAPGDAAKITLTDRGLAAIADCAQSAGGTPRQRSRLRPLEC
jgi:hypothetical protein